MIVEGHSFSSDEVIIMNANHSKRGKIIKLVFDFMESSFSSCRTVQGVYIKYETLARCKGM